MAGSLFLIPLILDDCKSGPEPTANLNPSCSGTKPRMRAPEPLKTEGGGQSRQNECRHGWQSPAQIARRIAAHLEVIAQFVEISSPFVPRQMLHQARMSHPITH